MISAPDRRSFQRVIRRTLLRAACCLFLSLSRIWQFDTFLVQHGHLTTFNVEEVLRHLEASRRHENFAQETQWDGIRSIHSKL